jgi:hypothetical protein
MPPPTAVEGAIPRVVAVTIGMVVTAVVIVVVVIVVVIIVVVVPVPHVGAGTEPESYPEGRSETEVKAG